MDDCSSTLSDLAASGHRCELSWLAQSKLPKNWQTSRQGIHGHKKPERPFRSLFPKVGRTATESCLQVQGVCALAASKHSGSSPAAQTGRRMRDGYEQLRNGRCRCALVSTYEHLHDGGCRYAGQRRRGRAQALGCYVTGNARGSAAVQEPHSTGTERCP